MRNPAHIPLRAWVATITMPDGTVLTGTVYGLTVPEAEESTRIERRAARVVVRSELRISR
jgi:hypothetical protein